MRARNNLISFLMAALLLATSGCHSGGREIVGAWKVTSDSSALVWNFTADGSVTSGDMRGRYSFGDQSRIKIQTPFATFVYQVNINGDRMTWKAPNGTTTELTRVK